MAVARPLFEEEAIALPRLAPIACATTPLGRSVSTLTVAPGFTGRGPRDHRAQALQVAVQRHHRLAVGQRGRIGGAQRVERFRQLADRVLEHSGPPASFQEIARGKCWPLILIEHAFDV